MRFGRLACDLICERPGVGAVGSSERVWAADRGHHTPPAKWTKPPRAAYWEIGKSRASDRFVAIASYGAGVLAVSQAPSAGNTTWYWCSDLILFYSK